MTSPDDLERAAEEAVDAGIDRGFGDDSVAHCLAAAFADGIEVLRAADGTLDAELVADLVSRLDLDRDDRVVEDVVGARTRNEVISVLWGELEEALHGSEGEMVVEFIGDVEEVAAIDSSSFAGMTSGEIYLWVVRRKGELCAYLTGDDAGDAYGMYGRRREVDDPDLRGVRLEFAEAHGGYGAGVSMDTEDIDDDVREMTMNGGYWHDHWHYVIGHGIADLVEHYAATFAALTEQDDVVARSRLTALFESGIPQGELEARFLWDVWKKERPL